MENLFDYHPRLKSEIENNIIKYIENTDDLALTQAINELSKEYRRKFSHSRLVTDNKKASGIKGEMDFPIKSIVPTIDKKRNMEGRPLEINVNLERGKGVHGYSKEKKKGAIIKGKLDCACIGNSQETLNIGEYASLSDDTCKGEIGHSQNEMILGQIIKAIPFSSIELETFDYERMIQKKYNDFQDNM